MAGADCDTDADCRFLADECCGSGETCCTGCSVGVCWTHKYNLSSDINIYYNILDSEREMIIKVVGHSEGTTPEYLSIHDNYLRSSGSNGIIQVTNSEEYDLPDGGTEEFPVENIQITSNYIEHRFTGIINGVNIVLGAFGTGEVPDDVLIAGNWFNRPDDGCVEPLWIRNNTATDVTISGNDWTIDHFTCPVLSGTMYWWGDYDGDGVYDSDDYNALAAMGACEAGTTYDPFSPSGLCFLLDSDCDGDTDTQAEWTSAYTLSDPVYPAVYAFDAEDYCYCTSGLCVGGDDDGEQCRDDGDCASPGVCTYRFLAPIDLSDSFYCEQDYWDVCAKYDFTGDGILDDNDDCSTYGMCGGGFASCASVGLPSPLPDCDCP